MATSLDQLNLQVFHGFCIVWVYIGRAQKIHKGQTQKFLRSRGSFGVFAGCSRACAAEFHLFLPMLFVCMPFWPLPSNLQEGRGQNGFPPKKSSWRLLWMTPSLLLLACSEATEAHWQRLPLLSATSSTAELTESSCECVCGLLCARCRGSGSIFKQYLRSLSNKIPANSKKGKPRRKLPNRQIVCNHEDQQFPAVSSRWNLEDKGANTNDNRRCKPVTVAPFVPFSLSDLHPLSKWGTKNGRETP